MVIYKTTMSIVHIQCLLWIVGSIFASVFLTSFFCVVPESSDSSNAAISSLFVYVELGTPTALVQLIALSQQCTASLKDWHTIGGSRRHWQLFSSVDPYTVVSDTFPAKLAFGQIGWHLWEELANLDYSYSLSNCCCNGVLDVTFVVTVYKEFFGEPNSSPHKMSRVFSYVKPHKTHVLWTWVLWGLRLCSGFSNPRIDLKCVMFRSFMIILSCMWTLSNHASSPWPPPPTSLPYHF